MKRLIVWSVLTTLLLGAATVPAQANSRLGRKIDAFELRDHRGKNWTLEDFSDKKLIVVAFLGTECPLAKLYAPRLQDLSEEFAPQGVAFVGVNANRQDSLTEVGAYARVHGVTFPMLKDGGNVVADQFKAVRTPEVFILDGDRNVRYWGRIDDQYGLGDSSGYARPKVNRRDLAVALEELLAGKEVSQPVIEATGCFIGRVPSVDPHGDVTYTNQVARILKDRCIECHRDGEIAPFPLTSYDDVVGWGETMLEVIDEGRMPPWFADAERGHFRNDARMDDEEKAILRQWVANGSPEGDPADLPELPQYVEGWRIGQPDEIIYMRDEPFTVKAEGTVEYQYFSVDPGWTEGKWIKTTEAVPDNRAVVHHIIVFFQPPRDRKAERKARAEGRKLERDEGGSIGGYAPGSSPDVQVDGVAQYVPAGSTLTFQLHYTPNGSVQKDRSYVGIIYADPSEVKRKKRGAVAINQSFSIPAGADHHKVEADYRFERDLLLVDMMPHMHLRGKAMRFDAHYPDGRKELLLDVPKYDFNWQLTYELAQPKLMPKGTVIHCTAHFDNSENNLANPDPTETVHWGDQTWEEMMIGFMGTVAVEQDVFVNQESDSDSDAGE